MEFVRSFIHSRVELRKQLKKLSLLSFPSALLPSPFIQYQYSLLDSLLLFHFSSCKNSSHYHYKHIHTQHESFCQISYSSSLSIPLPPQIAFFTFFLSFTLIPSFPYFQLFNPFFFFISRSLNVKLFISLYSSSRTRLIPHLHSDDFSTSIVPPSTSPSARLYTHSFHPNNNEHTKEQRQPCFADTYKT